MKYINQEIFGIFFGIFFSFPTSADIFLQYLVPIITNKSINPTINLGITIISCIIFISTWIMLFDVIKKYHKMRGILTNNHLRNIIIAGVLGSMIGISLHAIVF